MRAVSSRIFTLPFGSAIAFASGIAAARICSLSSTHWLILAGTALAAFWLAKRLAATRSSWNLVVIGTCLVLAIAAGGAAVAARFQHSYLASPLLQLASRASFDPSQPVQVRGWVLSAPGVRRDRLRFTFQVDEVLQRGHWRRCAGRVRVSLRNPGEAFRPTYGSRLEMPLRLRRGRSFRNPGAFDYSASLQAEGIHLLGNLKSHQLARLLPGAAGAAPIVVVNRLRGRLRHRLDRAFPAPEGEECRRFLAAILLGERDGGEGRADALFRKTGVYHIVSISGLHFALLIAFVRFLARRSRPRPIVEPLLLLLVGGGYVLLSGGDDPILRCALAAAVQEVGERLGRRVGAWNAQSLAAFVLLACRPMELFTPGFQLSFLATWGILAWRRPWWPRLRRIPLAGEGMAASCGAWVASTPLMAAWFLQVSPVALLLNLIAGPFLMLSMVLGALLLIAPLEPLARLMSAALETFGGCCALALQAPAASLRVPSPAFPLAAGLAGCLLARLHLGAAASREEARSLNLALLSGLLLLCFPPHPWLPPNQLELTVLDVGQGDAILLGLPGPKWVLVDGGGFAATDFDVGERVVLPALFARGVRQLEIVILTHAHQDHGGGLPAILEALPPREIWMGRTPAGSPLAERIETYASRAGISVLHPTHGALRCLGPACLEVLHPPAIYRIGRAVANDDSLVLRVSFGPSAALLTGDLESAGESVFRGALRSRPSQLLKVAHHGSSSSTSEAFLEEASPRFAVISVGSGNPWGHPSPVVLRRLEQRGIAVWRTDRDGAVRWVAEGGRWDYRPFTWTTED